MAPIAPIRTVSCITPTKEPLRCCNSSKTLSPKATPTSSAPSAWTTLTRRPRPNRLFRGALAGLRAFGAGFFRLGSFCTGPLQGGFCAGGLVGVIDGGACGLVGVGLGVGDSRRGVGGIWDPGDLAPQRG